MGHYPPDLSAGLMAIILMDLEERNLWRFFLSLGTFLAAAAQVSLNPYLRPLVDNLTLELQSRIVARVASGTLTARTLAGPLGPHIAYVLIAVQSCVPDGLRISFIEKLSIFKAVLDGVRARTSAGYLPPFSAIRPAYPGPAVPQPPPPAPAIPTFVLLDELPPAASGPPSLNPPAYAPVSQAIPPRRQRARQSEPLTEPPRAQAVDVHQASRGITLFFIMLPLSITL